jgi:hypothetical protein
MKKFYVNKKAQDNGDHEVHNEDCQHLPFLDNRRYLGDFYSCAGALSEAKKFYATADGCIICSRTCHKQ